MKPSISVIGLGKLGAPLAACLAWKGLRVIGVDVDGQKVDAINHRRAPVFEPGLEQLVKDSEGRLVATQDLESAVLSSQITFIVLRTPSEATGEFSLRFVAPACEGIGRALRSKLDFHLVVVTSTVMPGSTGGSIRTTLEKASGKVCGKDFGLCYGPEFIALGTVIRDFLSPDFILIGESDPRSGELLQTVYREVCENSPPVARMNFINAELAKLALNTFITTKISFANMLARICEKLPGANVDTVAKALGLDSRIGPKYLKGAISYGGPCFPRDNLALTALARQAGASAEVAEVTDRYNRWQTGWLADAIQQHVPPGGKVGILGLTYKPNTDVVEEAPGLLLAIELCGRGLPVSVFDPAGQASAVRVLKQAHFAESAACCIENADVIVLATPWAEFFEVPPERWARYSPPRVVIDCWRLLPHLSSVDGIQYVPLGIGAVSTDHLPPGPRTGIDRKSD